MLVLTRKTGQSITIQPDTKLDPATPVGTLFNDGPIELQIKQVGRGSVTLGINANKQFCILRNELQPQTTVETLQTRDKLTSQEVLAKNVNSMSKKLELSSEQLAEQSGLPLATITAIKSGQGAVMLADLDCLAQVLAVNVSALLRNQ